MGPFICVLQADWHPECITHASLVADPVNRASDEPAFATNKPIPTMVPLMTAIRSASALLVGGAIGFGFGTISSSTRPKKDAPPSAGKLKTTLHNALGSGRRTAYLLVALLLVQIVFPLLFANGVQWWIYGGQLLRRRT